MRKLLGCLLERPRLIPSIALASSFERVRAGVSAQARQPHGWMLIMRGRAVVRSSYELQRPWGAPVTRFRMSMLCDVASTQNPLGALLCSRCARTWVKVERIARLATPFKAWTSGGASILLTPCSSSKC